VRGDRTSCCSYYHRIVRTTIVRYQLVKGDDSCARCNTMLLAPASSFREGTSRVAQRE
jgi:hypothetical protein